MPTSPAVSFAATALHTRYYASLLVVTLLLHLALHNLCAATRLFLRSPARPILALNLIQTFFPCLAGVVFITRKLVPWSIGCQLVSRLEATAMIGGEPVLFALLLVKAYFVCSRSMVVGLVGAMCVCVELVVGILLHHARHVVAPVIVSSLGGAVAVVMVNTRCDVEISSAWIGLNLATDVCANLFLSVLFLHAVYRQRRVLTQSASSSSSVSSQQHRSPSTSLYSSTMTTSHSNVYTILVRDGLIYAILIPISNLTAAIIAWKYPVWSGHVYAGDYLLASTLMVWQFENGDRWREARRKAVQERELRRERVALARPRLMRQRQQQREKQQGMQRRETVASLEPSASSLPWQQGMTRSRLASFDSLVPPLSPVDKYLLPVHNHAAGNHRNTSLVSSLSVPQSTSVARKPSLVESIARLLTRESSWREDCLSSSDIDEFEYDDGDEDDGLEDNGSSCAARSVVGDVFSVLEGDKWPVAGVVHHYQATVMGGSTADVWLPSGWSSGTTTPRTPRGGIDWRRLPSPMHSPSTSSKGADRSSTPPPRPRLSISVANASSGEEVRKWSASSYGSHHEPGELKNDDEYVPGRSPLPSPLSFPEHSRVIHATGSQQASMHTTRRLSSACGMDMGLRTRSLVRHRRLSQIDNPDMSDRVVERQLNEGSLATTAALVPQPEYRDLG